MGVVKRDVYVTEFKDMTYRERLFFVVANFCVPRKHFFMPNINPLDWCVRDALKVVSFIVLLTVIYPFVALPISLYGAYRLKRDEFESPTIYYRNMYILTR